MKRLLAALSIALLSAVPSMVKAADAENTFTYSGYLLTPSGTPESSTQSVVFSLYTVPTGGTADWSVTKPITPNATTGYFSATLGEPPSTFALANIDFSIQHYLGIKVGSELEMLPRIKVGAAPRALSVDWTAINLIPAQCSGPTPLLQGFDATGAPVCIAQTVDTNTTYTASLPILLTGTVFSMAAASGSADGYLTSANFTTFNNKLSSAAGAVGTTNLADGAVTPAKVAACASAGQVLKWNGSAWACAADDNTGATYSAGANGGLVVNSNAFSINNAGCTSGQVLTFLGPGWGCTTPSSSGVASVTAATNGGVAVAGTATAPTVGLLTSCGSGEGLKWNGTAWACAADANTTYGAGNGLSLAAGNFAVNSPTCLATEVSRWNGTVWVCVAQTVDTNTTYGAGNGLSLAAGNFVVNSPTCAAGEVSRWNGTLWTCVADANTTYGATATGGLALTGTNFGLTTCGDGLILKMTGGVWTCSADAGGSGTISDVTQAANAISAVANAGVAVTTSGSARTVGLKACVATGQVLKYDLGLNLWTCQADTDTTYLAGNGLSLSAGAFVVNSPTCLATEVSRWNGTAWVCVAQTLDTNTTYSNGTGLLLAGTVFSANLVASGGDAGVATTIARSDHVHSSYATAASVTALGTAGTINTGTNPMDWTKLKGVPAGIADGVDADTTYWPLAGGGLALTGQAFGLTTAGCNNTFVMKYDGFNWSCQPDANNVYTAGNGITIASNSVAANFTVSGGENGLNALVARGDHFHDGRYYTEAELNTFVNGNVNSPTNPVDWTQLKSMPAGFADATDNDSGGTVRQVTITGGGLELGGSATLNPSIGLTTACLDGQILKWNGTDWACADDVDTNSGGTVTSVGPTANGGTVAGGTAAAPTIGLLTSCAANQILKWNGTAWACAADVNSGGTVTGLTADVKGGMAVSTVAPASPAMPSVGLIQTCSAGEVLKWSVANGWICNTDIDTNTTYSNGTGLLLTGTVFSANLVASGGDAGIATTIARSDHVHSSYATAASVTALGTAGTINTVSNPMEWTKLKNVPAGIADGVDADTTYSAGLGLLLTGTVFSPNFTATGGDNGGGTTVARGDHVHDGRYYAQTVLNTAGVINTATNPVDWTKLKGVPAALADGVDNDTTYTAGNGLTLTGTSLAINTAQTQARVTGSCAGGITSINAAGGVTCSPSQTYGFASGSAIAPAYNVTAVIAFIAAPSLVTVDGTQYLQVVSTAALGAGAAGAATNLNLWICSHLQGSALPLTAAGGGTFGLTAPLNNRHLYTLSANIYGLAAGTYEFGLCGYAATTPNYWTNNEFSYTSITTVN